MAAEESTHRVKLDFRWLHPTIWLLLLYFSMLQRWGETTFDTKFDLTENPAGFLSRSTHLWNPQASFGEIQNQAYGYLFPQGTFFFVGNGLGLEPWVVQRLWSALLLIVAYEGARRLWRHLSGNTRVLTGAAAGLAYAFGPRLLGLDGTLTGEVLPTAVLPWLVLPLLLGRAGRLGPRTAALLSATALLCCGGLNAVENLAILPLPFLLLLAGWRDTDGRARMMWWLGATALATLWWMLPLFVMGAYSPPFLDYIETASATTQQLGWFNVVRGANHWVGFVDSGGTPFWPASYALSVTRTGMVLTGLVAVPLIVGLFSRRLALRRVWVASFLLGAACLVVGHTSTMGSPLALTVQSLLDGPLAPFRNVHKVDPLMRLPLALGAGNAVAVALQWGSGVTWRRVVGWSAAGLTGLLIVASAFPLYQGQMRRPGWKEIPQAWREAAQFMNEHQDEGRVLVLPGSGFANQTWGITVDEPIQALTSAAWATRSQVPLAPGPTIRLLDAIEERISTGIGSPQLGELLARSGVAYVLVRRDLDPMATDAPPPNRVDMAMGRSGGLTSVAGFGETDVGALPLLQIYRVDAAASKVEAHAVADHQVIAGDPGDVLGGLEAGVIAPEGTSLFRHDAPDTSPDLQADGYRLVQRQFGRVHDATTGVMSEGDPIQGGGAALDYASVAGEKPTVLFDEGLVGVSASSSAGYVDNAGASQATSGPYAAVDGDESTSWRTSNFRDSREAWLRLQLREPLKVGVLTVRFNTEEDFAQVRRVRVTSDDDSVVVSVDPQSGLALARLNGAQTDQITVSVESVLQPEEGGSDVVGLREIWIPDLPRDQRLMVPEAAADSRTSFLFQARIPRGACTPTLGGPVCDLGAIRSGDPQEAIRRQFTSSGGTVELSGKVVARPTESVQELAHPYLPKFVTLASGSVFANDPLVMPQFAYDGDPTSMWLSEPGAESPSLTLKWEGKRTLSRIRVTRPSGAVGPAAVTLTAGSQTRTVSLNGQYSDGSFEPLHTDRVKLTFLRPRDASPSAPLGVAEMRIDGLDDARAELSRGQSTGSICGLGPQIRIDNYLIETRVEGTLADLVDGAPMSYRSCSKPRWVGPGTHELEVSPTGQFLPVSLLMKAVERRPVDTEPDRWTALTAWGPTRRAVQVGAGPQAILRIPENQNAGWVATLNGKALDVVSPDGWQQGYVIPEGDGGVVELRFKPDRVFRLALLIGLLSALLVAGGAVASVLAERRHQTSAKQDESTAAGDPACSASAGKRGRITRWGRATWLVLGGLLGGVPVALGLLIAWITRERWCLPAAAALLTLAVPVSLVSGAAAMLGADLLAGAGIGLLIGHLWGEVTDA